MDNEFENADSSNGENNIVTDDTIVSSDAAALQQKLSKLEDTNRQLFIRAKKAEGFEFKDGHWFKPTKPEVPVIVEKTKSSEKDYGKKAFLAASGIKGADEVELIERYEAKGMAVEDLLDDTTVEGSVFKTALEKLREARTTATAIPTSSQRSTTTTSDNVDYWMAKPFEEVPEDMKQAVIDKRYQQESNKAKFTKQSVVDGV